jgi:exodeoxyribonuclease VII small subunit
MTNTPPPEVPSGSKDAVGARPGAGPDGLDGLDGLDGRSFESLVEELEEVARTMDRGELGVEAVTELYVRARQLHRAASARLDAVRARLETLAAEGGA